MSEVTDVKRLFANQPSPVTQTYKEKAYQIIRDAILFQQFQIGVVYSQENICKEFGISRTPVREALLELQKEGYITYNRSKGIQIVPVTQSEAHDILEMRVYNEKLSAGLAAQRASTGDITMIQRRVNETRQHLDCNDTSLLYRIDHQFHRDIAAATHNSWIMRVCDILLNHYLRFEVKSVYLNPENAQKILSEHVAVCDAIVNREPRRAEEEIEKHLNNSYQRTVSNYWD